MTAGAPLSNPKIGEAAAWLSSQDPRPSPVVPALRERFGLSALEAVQAIRAAHDGGAQ